MILTGHHYHGLDGSPHAIIFGDLNIIYKKINKLILLNIYLFEIFFKILVNIFISFL